MMTPHLGERWIEPNGELAVEPQSGISPEDDLLGGLEKFARVFRPRKVSDMRILIEGWEDEVCVHWEWEWNPASFVGGVASRYSFGGTWCPWDLNHAYGYSPGYRPGSQGGISMKIQEYGVLFEVEVALLGLCCMSRGPITKLGGLIPPKEEIPTRQPALLLNKLIHFEEAAH